MARSPCGVAATHRKSHFAPAPVGAALAAALAAVAILASAIVLIAAPIALAQGASGTSAVNSPAGPPLGGVNAIVKLA